MNSKAKELMHFLREQKCLYKFKRNMRNKKCFGVSDLFDRDNPTIGHAFLWDSTPEGHCYWKNLHKLYLEEIA